MKTVPILMLLLLSLASCQGTYQYGVNVNNETGETLKIKYKSLQDVNGVVEETIELKSGERKRIIWTVDIDTQDGATATTAEHCQLVAEYVTAYAQDSIPANLEWCDKKIVFEKTDIQQAEFTINYTKDHFPSLISEK